jgi:hypothetical protein
VKRGGFSLVELVFSIIVIAIALMTVPLMLGQSSQSNQYALMQESILAARTKMGNILSFRWDENAADANGSVVRVLDVANGASALDRNTTFRRKGHIEEDYRRRMTDSEVNASLGQETVDVFDDIDDFDGESAIVAASGAAGVQGTFDYLDKDLNLTTIVRFISDDTNYSKQSITFDFNVSTATSNINQSTNIKMIELNATSTNRADLPFVFRTFSSNIGQSKLYERLK